MEWPSDTSFPNKSDEPNQLLWHQQSCSCLKEYSTLSKSPTMITGRAVNMTLYRD